MKVKGFFNMTKLEYKEIKEEYDHIKFQMLNFRKKYSLNKRKFVGMKFQKIGYFSLTKDEMILAFIDKYINAIIIFFNLIGICIWIFG
jgi:hypothetical protein